MALQTAIDIVDEATNKMFVEIVREYSLPSGDIAPEQVATLDNIKNELSELLSDFVYNNLPEDKGAL